MAKKISAARKKLLIKLESLIGNECYNSNIQNWGPYGVFEGSGREFRYPITFRDSENEKFKRRHVESDIDAKSLLGGYYAFGANELHIMAGLERVLLFLEEEYGFKPEKLK